MRLFVYVCMYVYGWAYPVTTRNAQDKTPLQHDPRPSPGKIFAHVVNDQLLSKNGAVSEKAARSS